MSIITVLEKDVIGMAVGKLESIINEITPEQEQKAADFIKAKLGGNEAIEFAAIKGAIATVQAIVAVLPDIATLI